ncbi:hypothetical protein [Rhodococcus tukisamuensis]|uniref:Uncharacterized protein n=1 Tax=Rhodococcus tukisamuensis TaxID=168276 RepID=A0A1G6WYY4_9NOCA|nr:hypothetical protein [Rhodococcus tukisamuensis]SDD71098.1 hypothetical protein SAMN05444580_10632 [Rhodococcus tukisamuensis]
MRRTTGIIGATIAAVGLTIGTAGLASALPTAIPGTTGHPYVAGVDVESGSYMSFNSDATGLSCYFGVTPGGNGQPNSSFGPGFSFVTLESGDRFDSAGCGDWFLLPAALGSVGSVDSTGS